MRLINLLFVIVLLLFGASIANAQETAVTAGSDDARENTDGSVNLTTVDTANELDDVNEWAGFRFLNMTIPPGATITAAYLRGVPTTSTQDEPLVTIYFEDADNPGTFTSGANNISSRARTTANTVWDSANLGADGATYYDSPSLVAALQEVIDRPGWASGNALVVIMQGGADVNRDLRIETFENTGANPPLLHVEYSGGGGGGGGKRQVMIFHVGE